MQDRSLPKGRDAFGSRILARPVLLTMLLTATIFSVLFFSVGQRAHAHEEMTSAASEVPAANPHEHDHSMLAAAPNLAAAEVPTGTITGLFEADLSSGNEVAAPDTIATGRVVAALIDDTLYLRLFANDADKISAAHIHGGAAGVNGSILHTLWTSGTLPALAPGSPITAVVEITVAEQITELLAGNLYVNFHSSDIPAGEARGQLRVYTPTRQFMAPLLGAFQVPPVTTTTAAGVARFVLADAETLEYEIYTSGLVSITAAHIHRAATGVNGPVVAPIPTETLASTGIATGSVSLTPEDLVDLLTGNLYLNVHTAANQPGEIRGQIGGAQLFQACLDGASEVPANITNTVATGEAIMALEADASTLYYRLAIDDLGVAAASHIHKGVVGQNGGVIFNLIESGKTLSDTSAVTGTLTLTPAQVLDLITGKYYVNVHSAKLPAGEIRGQVTPLAAPGHLLAALTGAAEVPAVATKAVGVARFTLDELLDRIYYSVAVTDITGITAAHIHRGATGVNGGVVYGLYASGGSEIFSPADPIGGGNAVTGRDWVNLLSGQYYVNAHTPANPSGEIRGQIGGPQLYAAALDGLAETPAVTTTATGEAVLALSRDATTLAYRIFVSEIPTITAAHIHRGEAGVAGPVAVGLYSGGGGFDDSAPLSGTIALATPQVLDLIAGRHYLNVHTTANSGGEIRGQVEPLQSVEDVFYAVLNGSAEVPPVTSTATGLVRFKLLPEQGVLHYTLAVSDLVSATQSHIHVGAVGKNGGVVHFLFRAAGGNLLDSAHPASGCLLLNSVDMVNLLTEYWYVNVHTSANPGGEIRGQILAPSESYLPAIYRN